MYHIASIGRGKELRVSYRMFLATANRMTAKAFLSDHCKEIEENNRMGRLEISSSRKLETPKEHFMQR